MANSLIELYGGGMAGKSNNYQLGGRVASAKRRREYQGEMREIQRKQEEANRRKKKSGFLGTLGSIAGGTVGFMLGGPGGAAIGASLGRGAGESSYAREDFSGGKYAQETRGDLRQREDDYRSSIGEKMAVDALSAYLMPGMYEGLGKGAKSLGRFAKGIPTEIEAGKEMGLGTLQSLGEYAGDFAALQPSTAASTAASLAMPDRVSTPTPDVASIVSPTVSTAPATLVPEGVDFLSGGFDLSTTAQPQANPYEYFGPYFNRGGGLIDMNTPQYENGGMIRERYDAMNRPTSFGNQVNPAGEMRNTYGQPVQPQTPYAPPTPPPAPYTPGYGTATNTVGALTQMGMGDIANDPRFAQYADDLPDFQMGYAQQVGDIYSGARQSARSMRGQQMEAAGQRGFAGSGIGQRQTQQAFGDLTTDVARQRRGVVEGFQADLLGAIGDIEAKGEFEFGQPDENTYGGGTLGQLMGQLVNRQQQSQFNPQQAQDATQAVQDTLQRMRAAAGITPPQPIVPSTPEEQEMSDYYDRTYG